MDKTLEHLKETLEDEIKKIVKKGDITPAELESVQKAVCTIDMIDGMMGNSEAMSESYGSYRGYSRNHMPYEHMAYGDSYDNYSNRAYRGRSYDRGYYEGDSYRRGRSPVTGRYISRDAYGHDGRSYNDGYSGHSIMDRMVAKLESMYDEAQTDHDRQMVDQWIQKLRNGN